MKWSDLNFQTAAGSAMWETDYRAARAEAGEAEGLGLWYGKGLQPWDNGEKQLDLNIGLGEKKHDLLTDWRLGMKEK